MLTIPKTLIALLVLVATSVVALQYKHIQKLNADNALTNEQLQTANSRVEAQASAISTLEKSISENGKAQVKLRQDLNIANARSDDYEHMIEVLKNENAAYRSWANSPLPDALILLQQHPAITGSQSYQDWVSRRNALPATSQSGHDQRSTPASTE